MDNCQIIVIFLAVLSIVLVWALYFTNRNRINERILKRQIKLYDKFVDGMEEFSGNIIIDEQIKKLRRDIDKAC